MKQFAQKFLCCSLLLISVHMMSQSSAWGWNGHRYINEMALDYLPPEMDFWQEQTQFLHDHAIDPDVDSEPIEYHYINIDYYPEFFEGTLSHDLDELALQYGQGVVQDNGVVPWIIDIWSEELTSLMEAGEWDDAWQIAAELGHYVADAHEPMHLTLNYDGQLTGNDGIHSRYETQMINDHLDDIVLIPGTGEYWPNVLDSAFAWIDVMFPYVDDILAADDLASEADPGFGNEYYSLLWQETEELTNESMNLAVYNLACVWITAWENAGSPIPLEIAQSKVPVLQVNVFPNPTSDFITVKVRDSVLSTLTIDLIDVLGRTMQTSQINRGNAVTYLDVQSIQAGIYTVRIRINDQVQSHQIMVSR